jgi:hypothetical protein
MSFQSGAFQSGAFQGDYWAATNLTITNTSGLPNSTITLTATLAQGYAPIPNAIIDFSVGGVAVGNATTNSSGIATLNYTIPTGATGNEVINANYNGTINGIKGIFIHETDNGYPTYRNIDLATLETMGYTDIYFLCTYGSGGNYQTALSYVINQFKGSGIRVNAWLVNHSDFTPGDESTWVLPLAAVEDIAQNYDVAGIVLDEFKWLGTPGNISYQQSPNGNIAVQQFHKQAYELIKGVNQDLKVIFTIPPETAPAPYTGTLIEGEYGDDYYYGVNFSMMGDYGDYFLVMTYLGDYGELSNPSWIDTTITFIQGYISNTVIAIIETYNSDEDITNKSRTELNLEATQALLHGQGYANFRYGLISSYPTVNPPTRGELAPSSGEGNLTIGSSPTPLIQNRFYFADMDGNPLPQIILGEVYPQNIGISKKLQIIPASGVTLSNITITPAPLNNSYIPVAYQERCANSYQYIQLSSNDNLYKTTLDLTLPEPFYIRSVIPAWALVGDYLCSLTVSATCTTSEGTVTDVETIFVAGVVYLDDYDRKPLPLPLGVSAQTPDGTFDTSSFQAEDRQGDGTSTFQCTINEDKTHYFFSGEKVSFIEKIGDMQRVMYSGVMDNPKLIKASAATSYTLIGVGPNIDLTKQDFEWSAGISAESGYDSSVQISSGFDRDVSAQYEVVDLGTFNFNWGGNGGVFILPTPNSDASDPIWVDDEITVTTSLGSVSANDLDTSQPMSTGNVPYCNAPVDITSILRKGENSISVSITDINAHEIGCSALYIVQTSFTASFILQQIFTDTLISMGDGIDLDIGTISNNINDWPGWSGTWNTKIDAINDLINLISMVQGKEIVWYIDQNNNFRTYYYNEYNPDQALQIYLNNPRLIEIDFDENGTSVVNRLSGTGGNDSSGNPITYTVYDPESQNGWNDTISGKWHPGYGVITGSPYQNSAITDIDVLETVMNMLLGRQSQPIYTVVISLVGFTYASKGQPLYLPDLPQCSGNGEQISYVVSDVLWAQTAQGILTTITATTDFNTLGPLTSYSVIQAISTATVKEAAPETGSAIGIDSNGNLVVEKTVGGAIINISQN